MSFAKRFGTFTRWTLRCGDADLSAHGQSLFAYIPRCYRKGIASEFELGQAA